MSNDLRYFKHKSTGAIVQYPAHYQNHPAFKNDLVPYVLKDGEFVECKTCGQSKTKDNK